MFLFIIELKCSSNSSFRLKYQLLCEALSCRYRIARALLAYKSHFLKLFKRYPVSVLELCVDVVRARILGQSLDESAGADTCLIPRVEYGSEKALQRQKQSSSDRTSQSWTCITSHSKPLFCLFVSSLLCLSVNISSCMRLKTCSARKRA